MAWTAQGGVDLHATQLQDRLSRRYDQVQSLQELQHGTAQLAASASLILYGSTGGVFDNLFTLLTYVAIFPEGTVDIYASKDTVANNPTRIGKDGAYYTPDCQVDHLVITNTSSTDAVRVTFYVGGDR